MMPYTESRHDCNRRPSRSAPEQRGQEPPAPRGSQQGMPVAAFVRAAALREAEVVVAQTHKTRRGSLAARLRGRATARLSTDAIMQLTCGA